MKIMLFITFEGIDGSGKTTILSAIKRKFTEISIEIKITREPGGNIISEQIRQVILNRSHQLMDSWTEVLLYTAARRQHFTEKIFPELTSQSILICDRFFDSTTAYQGYGRGLEIAKIKTLQTLALGDFSPNLTILFDIDPEIALKRIQNRSQNDFNRFDEEKIQFHQKVRQGYLKIAQENSERIKIVDASQPFDQVVETTFTIINNLIKSRK